MRRILLTLFALFGCAFMPIHAIAQVVPPPLPPPAAVPAAVPVSSNSTCTVTTKDGTTLNGINPFVCETLERKAQGWQEDEILDHFYSRALNRKHIGATTKPVTKGVVGYLNLSSNDITALNDKGLSRDFVLKAEGKGSLVDTWGLAVVRMKKSGELAVAPMIQIHFARRNWERPLKSTLHSMKDPGFWLNGDRFDFTIGYTLNSTDADDTATVDNQRFLLTGFAYNLSREAQLNVGIAQVPGDKSSKQWYMGVTLDTAIFSKLGFSKE